MVYKKVVPYEAKKECITIVLACNEAYLKYTAVLLESIRANASADCFYDIVIFHHDVSNYLQQRVYDWFQKSSDIKLRFYNVASIMDAYASVYVSRHISIESYYRLLIPEIMSDYDKVLYLDCDLVTMKDISELYLTDISEYFIGAVRDYDFAMNLKKTDGKELYKEILSRTGLDEKDVYFQAGVLLFNMKKLKQGNITTSDLLKKAMSGKWFFHDQDVLNSVFKNKIKLLNAKWNVILLERGSASEDMFMRHSAPDLYEEYIESRRNPGIIHFAGTPKPWEDEAVDLACFFWKYARTSLFYEELLKDTLQEYHMPRGKIVFVGKNHYEDFRGVSVFSVNLRKEAWSESFILCDFVLLTDHDVPTASARLIADISSFPDQNYRVNKFLIEAYEKQFTYVFQNCVGYKLKDGKLYVYIRFRNRFEGMAWKIVFLESRDTIRPSLNVLQQGLISETIDLREEEVIFED